MKKLLTVVLTALFAGSLAFAQGTTGDKDKTKTAKPEAITIKQKADTAPLNPQPLPPGARKSKTLPKPAGSKVELNPQPLPPGAHDASQTTKPGSQVMLNPQPLPPRVVPTADKTNSKNKTKSKKGSASTNTGSTAPK